MLTIKDYILICYVWLCCFGLELFAGKIDGIERTKNISVFMRESEQILSNLRDRIRKSKEALDRLALESEKEDLLSDYEARQVKEIGAKIDLDIHKHSDIAKLTKDRNSVEQLRPNDLAGSLKTNKRALQDILSMLLPSNLTSSETLTDRLNDPQSMFFGIGNIFSSTSTSAPSATAPYEHAAMIRTIMRPPPPLPRRPGFSYLQRNGNVICFSVLHVCPTQAMTYSTEAANIISNTSTSQRENTKSSVAPVTQTKSLLPYDVYLNNQDIELEESTSSEKEGNINQIISSEKSDPDNSNSENVASPSASNIHDLNNPYSALPLDNIINTIHNKEINDNNNEITLNKFFFGGNDISREPFLDISTNRKKKSGFSTLFEKLAMTIASSTQSPNIATSSSATAGANSATAGSAIVGANSATAGSAIAGANSATTGSAIAGANSATTGTAIAGANSATTGSAIAGANSATTGSAIAGANNATTGTAIAGANSATTGSAIAGANSAITGSATSSVDNATTGSAIAGANSATTGSAIAGANSATTGSVTVSAVNATTGSTMQGTKNATTGSTIKSTNALTASNMQSTNTALTGSTVQSANNATSSTVKSSTTVEIQENETTISTDESMPPLLDWTTCLISTTSADEINTICTESTETCPNVSCPMANEESSTEGKISGSTASNGTTLTASTSEKLISTLNNTSIASTATPPSIVTSTTGKPISSTTGGTTPLSASTNKTSATTKKTNFFLKMLYYQPNTRKIHPRTTSVPQGLHVNNVPFQLVILEPQIFKLPHLNGTVLGLTSTP